MFLLSPVRVSPDISVLSSIMLAESDKKRELPWWRKLYRVIVASRAFLKE
jgi:hypothetical protein